MKKENAKFNIISADWRIVKILSEMIHALNPRGKILVIEGSAQTSTTETMRYYNYTTQSMPQVDEFISLEDSSGAWRAKNAPELIRVSLPTGLLQKEYYVSRRLKKADVVISVPTLKTHWSAVVTGAVKNLAVGSAPPSMYAEHQGSAYHGNLIDHEHPGLDYWIHDFYLCRPANFAITDGLQGIQNGPIPSSEKDRMNIRVILASRDAVALDGVAAQVMGQNPNSILYLRKLAKSRGVDFAKVVIKGESVASVKKQFGLSSPPK